MNGDQTKKKENDVGEITRICIQFSIFLICERTDFGIKTFQQLYHALKIIIIISNYHTIKTDTNYNSK